MPLCFAHFLHPIANRFSASVIAEEYEFDFPGRSFTSHLEPLLVYHKRYIADTGCPSEASLTPPAKIEL
jgi:hypothetical protein